jgi:predicted DNA-binding transcriptional regulator YafY
VGGALYLDDYDHLRRKLRTFAVERVRSLTVTDRAFQLPLGFDLDSYLGDALIVMQGTSVGLSRLSASPGRRRR